MKKTKHSDEWEEPSADSSKELEAVLGNLDDMDDLDDEIIDLEDIVEPYSDDHEDDDEFASDAEILSAEESLGFKGLDDKTESDDEFLLEDDLLKELPFFQDERAEPEPAQRADAVEEELEELAPGLFGDGDEEAVEGPEDRTETLFFEEPEPEMSASPVEASVPDEVQPEIFAVPVAEADVEEPAPKITTPPIEESVPEETQPEAFVLPVAAPFTGEPEPEVSAPTVPASAEVGASLDDFVARIESKLLDTIREIVEAKLPEIVRTVLREEIEKLKGDQEPDD